MRGLIYQINQKTYLTVSVSKCENKKWIQTRSSFQLNPYLESSRNHLLLSTPTFNIHRNCFRTYVPPMLDNKNNDKLSNHLQEKIKSEESDTELLSVEDRSREFSEIDIQSSRYMTDEDVILSTEMFEKSKQTAKELYREDKTVAKKLSPSDEDDTSKKWPTAPKPVWDVY